MVGISNLSNLDDINSGSTSGATNLNVHIFIDEFGNVTQTVKNPKKRLKYYIDSELPQTILEECVIGVNYSFEDKNCSAGTALGIGDNTMAYAKYKD